MYRGGRPNAVARAMNRAWARLAGTRLAPARLARLEVVARRSGCLVSLPVVVADLDGDDYLVSMLGERAGWVRNVRAAGGRAVLCRGRREAVTLCEVAPGVRGPVLKRYLGLAPGARAHVTVDRSASPAEFDRAAPDYPVFRVVPGWGAAAPERPSGVSTH